MMIECVGEPGENCEEDSNDVEFDDDGVVGADPCVDLGTATTAGAAAGDRAVGVERDEEANVDAFHDSAVVHVDDADCAANSLSAFEAGF
mmetsp:Transcript_3729/g.5333  ORF Transcript_3729/g.5333 Transcript_3729/m.5333 type:complete len:90 (-) Transcript_3729:1269-1538(-)